ncbi:MAG: Holliday junction branch migration protein RuvA [Caldithrix sp.]|nr:Holliday junction branch migration protein RuvA [Caldithrix sp.]
MNRTMLPMRWPWPFVTGTEVTRFWYKTMFEYIKGLLVNKTPTKAIIDVHGVGYALHTSVYTSEQLPANGTNVILKTYLHVREDQLQIFGFIDEDEREIFLALLSISGIGPRLAQTILSGMTPQKILTAIQHNDEKALSSISGVGKKTAQRLIVELKDKSEKIAQWPIEAAEKQLSQGIDDSRNAEALLALLSLGYSKMRAEKAIERVMSHNQELTTEEIIKKALQAV